MTELIYSVISLSKKKLNFKQNIMKYIQTSINQNTHEWISIFLNVKCLFKCYKHKHLKTKTP